MWRSGRCGLVAVVVRWPFSVEEWPLWIGGCYSVVAVQCGGVAVVDWWLL